MIEITKYRHIIGMTVEEAEKATGMAIRPTRVNGQHMIATADYRTDRINVSTEAGKITFIRGIG